MSHKAKILGPERIAVIEKYLRGEDSLNHLATLLDVSFQSIKQWLQTYQSLGPNALLSIQEYCLSHRIKDYGCQGLSGWCRLPYGNM